ncbi:hypothetical protein HK097_001791 [Rhizophlyctis rosea]|uniref:Uncharacterized protein n=1 Tax=Rhizophlyctis rosea TaxID=64517 RepID=A0AAD5SN23_9FUNG|nr:hypothetical protein HK097_001791 [Rhizophlyctis rosea]
MTAWPTVHFYLDSKIRETIVLTEFTGQTLFFSFERFKTLFEQGQFPTTVSVYTKVLAEPLNRLELVAQGIDQQWKKINSACEHLARFYKEAQDEKNHRKMRRWMEAHLTSAEFRTFRESCQSQNATDTESASWLTHNGKRLLRREKDADEANDDRVTKRPKVTFAATPQRLGNEQETFSGLSAENGPTTPEARNVLSLSAVTYHADEWEEVSGVDAEKPGLNVPKDAAKGEDENWMPSLQKPNGQAADPAPRIPSDNEVSFLQKYQMIVEINNCALCYKSKVLFQDVYGALLAAIDQVEQGEEGDLGRRWNGSITGRVAKELLFISRVETSSDDDCMPETASPTVNTSLVESRIHELMKKYHGCQSTKALVNIANRCLDLFTNPNKPNAIAKPSTREFEYRSVLIDRIFEDIFSERWGLRYTCGEPESAQVGRTQAHQLLDETSKAMQHDGVIELIFSDTAKAVEILFIEVVAGPSIQNTTKARSDRTKILKAMAISLDIQSKIAVGMDEETRGKIFAAGILIHQRQASIFLGRLVGIHTVIREIAKCTIPAGMSEWHEMGRLIEELYKLKNRMYILKKALSAAIKKIKVLPASSYPVTPKLGKAKTLTSIAKNNAAKDRKKKGIASGAAESDEE